MSHLKIAQSLGQRRNETVFAEPETKQADYLRTNFNINYNYDSENPKNSLEPHEFFDKFLGDFDDQDLKLIRSTLKKNEVKVASLNIDEICKALNDSLAAGSLQNFSTDKA